MLDLNEKYKIVVKADKSKELQVKIDLLNRVFDRMKVDE